MINTFFTKLGLTENEKNIYFFLLEHGAAIASIIGKRINIKRVTVYSALEALSKKDLITNYQKNGVSYFEALSPKMILEMCQKKVKQSIELQEQAEDIVCELEKKVKKQIKPVLEISGKIKYYQGLEAVKILIYETLEEGAVEQLCFGINSYHAEHLWDEWKDYTKKRAVIGMNVRAIQPDSEAARDYKNRDKDELRETRIVPDKFMSNCELNVIGDMIAMFTTHGNEPTGMKIYNKNMACVIRNLFELAWERAGEGGEKS